MNARFSRRRALAITGSSAAAATLLAACGGNESEPQEVSGLITDIRDTSSEARRGGIYKDSRTNDINSWDPFLLASPWNTTISALFQRLTIIKAGHLGPSGGEVEGNAAESWEFSPDRLTLTWRMRPNLNFHNIAPVNGRAVDVQDVMFSWNRFLSIGTSRSDYANNLNPRAPITSVAAADARTIVMKLAYPMATLPALFAYEYGGHFHILPKELDSGGFDLRNQPIGSGPWAFVEHRPSAGFTFKRHENYFEKDRPYLDRVEVAIIPEYAAGLAQFKSGALYRFNVRPEDILVTKQDVPDLSLYRADVSADSGGISFGWRPVASNVFRDVRMRQALSLSMDRDLFIEVNYNVSKFEQAGLPIETRWNTALPAHFYEGWWLDPRGKEFGENARYFVRDIAEAKKLMSAAGYANGVEVVATSAPDNYGQAYAKSAEIVQGFAADAGFRFRSNIVIYNTEFQPRYRDARGDFEGINYKPILGGDTDAIEHLISVYSKTAGPTFTGLDVNGAGDYSGDPYIEDQLFEARGETDVNRRKAIVANVQRHLAKQQYLLRHPGGASGLELAWPAVRNRLTYRAPQVSFRGPHYYEWLDETKPPLKA
jgi:ABC-type transport system substrate-binding protein